MVAVELAVSARYGIHRDELYFLQCAHHLAWGYVDQPPLVPLIARIETALFGTSASALRVAPAFAGGACVVLSGMMAREFGGARRAQVLAALAAATSAQVLATVHLLSTAAFDLFFWALLSLMFIRLLRTRDTRLWLAIGVVAGLGALNKYNIAFAAFALCVGLFLSGHRALFRGKHFAYCVAIAALLVLPNVAWNARHDWAAISMLHALHTENSTLGASIGFIPAQLFVVGPVLAPFWIGGLVRLWRHEIGRMIALAYLTLLALDTLSGAKSYYLGGIYFALFAGGGLWVEERVNRRRSSRGAGWIAAAMVIGALVSVPLTLPVLPVNTLAKSGWEGNINKDLSATVGWRPLVAQIAQTVAALPPARRTRIVIFTGDYGAAGAIDLFGSHYGLPHAVSGHNNYWWWGPPRGMDGATTIAIDLDRSYLETIFADVRAAGTVATPHNVWTEERGDQIWICTGQRITWDRAWPAARHYG
jgi:4-amino-4-deoxy-L-arabinose transferase-like glycosyltransferase